MKAIDFMKQLKQNPNYLEMQRQKEEEVQKKIVEAKNIEAPFIEDIHANEFIEIKSSGDLLKLKKVDVRLAALLLKWITQISNKHHSQEMLIRGLAVAEETFDGTLLIKLFDSESSSFNLKWAIGNTIASARVQNITDWLEDKLASDNLGKECEMLVYAVIKYFPYEKASVTLRKLFKVFPLQVAGAFTYMGKQEDLIF
ncbi:hypothetical protein ACI6Q2_17120 [Chitinophagaceae bacterium LWZ2-11]